MTAEASPASPDIQDAGLGKFDEVHLIFVHSPESIALDFGDDDRLFGKDSDNNDFDEDDIDIDGPGSTVGDLNV